MRPSASVPAAAASRALAALLLVGALASGCRYLPWPRSLPAPTLAPTVDYRVKRGDTVERIAAWHGADESEVRRLNGIGPDEAPAPGRVLRVPERPLASHALRRGDTLAQLAHWYGVDVEALIHLNDVADARRLAVGRVIRIPATATRDGRRAAAAAKPRARRAAAPAAPAAVSSAPSPPRADVDRALDRASEAFDAADFDGALAAARGAESQLTGQLAPDDRRRLARAHLLAGMSQVALGQDDEARQSFRAAVALDDSIALDPARTSPKVLGVFNEAQAGE